MSDEKNVKDIVSMLDGMMNNGGSHIDAKTLSEQILPDKNKTESCSLFTSDVNDCPACSNIPNISDIDE